jgi:hypothetical protein
MTPKQVQALEMKVAKLEKKIISMEAILLHLLPEDTEGEYKASFVRRIKKAAAVKPNRVFTDPKSFLADMRKV